MAARKTVVTLNLEAEDRFADLDATMLTAIEQDSIINLAIDILKRRHRRGESLASPHETRRFLQLKLAELPNEVFGAVFLDNRHRVIAIEGLFNGTIDGASVYPRVVVQRALACNAAAMIFYHNHPSGVAEPSQADRAITQKLKDALALVDVRVLDHLIVGVEDIASLAERGLL